MGGASGSGVEPSLGGVEPSVGGVDPSVGGVDPSPGGGAPPSGGGGCRGPQVPSVLPCGTTHTLPGQQSAETVQLPDVGTQMGPPSGTMRQRN